MDRMPGFGPVDRGSSPRRPMLNYLKEGLIVITWQGW